MWWASRLFWVPLVCIFYFVYGLISYKNNVTQGMFWFYVLYVFGGIIQLWVFVSKISNNIMFDSFLYDLCMMLSLCCALIVFRGIMPSFMQFMGVILCLIGLLLLR